MASVRYPAARPASPAVRARQCPAQGCPARLQAGDPRPKACVLGPGSAKFGGDLLKLGPQDITFHRDYLLNAN
jgi:hypothetical protein